MTKQEPAEKTLNLFPIDYPFETLFSRIQITPPKLRLDPEFQRKYKWDREGWERASRFIESCLMRIPLPACYFAEKEDGTHFVIDGVQRLTTIQKFFKDEFALEGMSAFKELEGKKFSELAGYQSELEATTIRCIVLRACYELPAEASTRAAAGNMSIAKTRKCSPPSTLGSRS